MQTPTAHQPESVLSSSQESGIEVTEDSLGLDEGQALDSTLKTFILLLDLQLVIFVLPWLDF